MTTSTKTAGMQSREDCRLCMTVVGVVYSPLILMTIAAIVSGLV